MDNYKLIPADAWNESPFRRIGKDWMLITACMNGKVNTMTASWGGLGILWGRPSAFIFVRDSRYTKEYLDASASFSLCFFDHAAYARQLSYLGTVSGRDEDKIANAGLTAAEQNGTPYFQEADTVIVCRKTAKQRLLPESFLSEEIEENFYGGTDYHTLYVGAIEEIWVKTV